MNPKLEQLAKVLTPITQEQQLEMARSWFARPPLPEVLSGEFVDALQLEFRDELAELARDYLQRKFEREKAR